MIRSSRTFSLSAFGVALAFACSPVSVGGGDGDGDVMETDDTNDAIDLGNDPDIGGDDLDGGVTDQPATENCGDGTLDADEACDDGNLMSGDGCGDNCRYVEPGFVCPDAGQPCRQYAKCGDGIHVFPEQCDDGNETPGDGCTDKCKIEIGWKCEGSPSACSPAVCGNGGEPEGAETCDDGNALPFDGCSERCQGEPICTESGCTSTCGDGLIIGEEECDDGNAISGDGCSSECKQEPGYECTTAPPCPDGGTDCPLQLPIVIRDFPEAHSDFHAPDTDNANRPCDGGALGMVAPTLDAAGKPTFVTAPAHACVTNFQDWYVDSPNSSTILSSVTLYPTGDGSYVNRFGDNGEQYEASIAAPGQTNMGATLAECGTRCEQHARDAQGMFMGMGHRRCNDLCQPLDLAAQQLEDVTLAQAQNQLTQAENAQTPDEDLIAELEAEIEDIMVQIEDAQAEAAECRTDCEDDLAARTEECTAECAPCGGGQTGFCTGVEVMLLDGDPLFFPIDDHPDALMDVRYGARIPAQIYMGFGWPWETGECPLDDQICATSSIKHNFHFTSEIAYWFEYTEGMAADLTFVGDDDVYVFVNRQLVIDLGGIHVPWGGEFTINGGNITTRAWQADDESTEDDDPGPIPTPNPTMTAADLGLVPGNVYEIKVFHAERKPQGSSFQLTLSGFDSARSECNSICGDGILAAGEQCDLGDELNVGGHDGCNADCTLGSYCGDGIVQEEFEACDDADPNKPANCNGCRIIEIH